MQQDTKKRKSREKFTTEKENLNNKIKTTSRDK